jgi:hypothetical protein
MDNWWVREVASKHGRVKSEPTIGDLLGLEQTRVVHGVGGVGRHHHGHQRVVLVLVVQLAQTCSNRTTHMAHS